MVEFSRFATSKLPNDAYKRERPPKWAGFQRIELMPIRAPVKL